MLTLTNNKEATKEIKRRLRYIECRIKKIFDKLDINTTKQEYDKSFIRILTYEKERFELLALLKKIKN